MNQTDTTFVIILAICVQLMFAIICGCGGYVYGVIKTTKKHNDTTETINSIHVEK